MHTSHYDAIQHQGDIMISSGLQHQEDKSKTFVRAKNFIAQVGWGACADCLHTWAAFFVLLMAGIMMAINASKLLNGLHESNFDPDVCICGKLIQSSRAKASTHAP